MYNSINPNASINKSVSISSKVFACDTGFNLKDEDFFMLPCNVSVHNSVCNSDKPIVKFFRRSFLKLKVVSASSVLPGKPINDNHVCCSKLVSASSVRSSKPIRSSNIRVTCLF